MSSVCFFIFGRPIYWYGVMIAAAFLACITHLSMLGRREGRSYAFVSDLGFWVMVSGIVGARIAYVLANLNYFLEDPGLIIRIELKALAALVDAALGTVGIGRGQRRPHIFQTDAVFEQGLRVEFHPDGRQRTAADTDLPDSLHL